MVDEQYADHQEGRGGESQSALLPLAVVFFPGTVIAILMYYFLLRKMHRRFSVSLIYAMGLMALVVSLSWLFDVIGLAKGSIFDAWGQMSALPLLGLTPLWVSLSLMLGIVAGVAAIGNQVYLIKRNPHFTKIPDRWTYNFKYAPTPLERFRRKRLEDSLKAGTVPSSPRSIPLGIEEETGDLIVRSEEESVIGGTLVTGKPGSGKTITMMTCVENDIKHKVPIVFLDFKRDNELASKLATFCKQANVDFRHFDGGTPGEYSVVNSPGQSYYDPLAIATRSSRVEMILNMREYDAASDHYKGLMKGILEMLFRAFTVADRTKTMSATFVEASTGNSIEDLSKYAQQRGLSKSDVNEMILKGEIVRKMKSDLDWEAGDIYLLRSVLRGNNFEKLASACSHEEYFHAEMIAFWNKVLQRGTDQQKQWLALENQIATLINSESGQWLKLSGTERDINIYDLTSANNGGVILFSMSSEAEKDFSKFFGSLIFSDLNNVSAKRRENMVTTPLHVYADEFQAVPPSSVRGLLEKARGSKISVMLSCQSLEQISDAAGSNGETVLKAILDTCSNFIVHQGSVQATAERYAGIFGKDKMPDYSAETLSVNFIGEIFNNIRRKRNMEVHTRTITDWVIQPSVFMSLTSPTSENGWKSTAVIVNKTVTDKKYAHHKGALARVVQVIPPESVSKQKIYQGKAAAASLESSRDGVQIDHVSSLEQYGMDGLVPNSDPLSLTEAESSPAVSQMPQGSYQYVNETDDADKVSAVASGLTLPPMGDTLGSELPLSPPAESIPDNWNYNDTDEGDWGFEENVPQLTADEKPQTSYQKLVDERNKALAEKKRTPKTSRKNAPEAAKQDVGLPALSNQDPVKETDDSLPSIDSFFNFDFD